MTLPGRSRTLADTGRRSAHSISRRAAIQLGTLGVGGLSLTDLLAAGPASQSIALPNASHLSNQLPGFGAAKSIILMFMWGGPSHIDTWDPKPDAPAEVRGEFKPIDTATPGIQISEHFPLLARQTEQLAIVRSVSHDDPAHLSTVHHYLTGHIAPQPKSDAVPPSRKDHPHIGSVLAALKNNPATQQTSAAGSLPQFVTLPWLVSHPAAPGGMAVGQNAGWMGQKHDPFVITGDPNDPGFKVSGLQLSDGISRDRFLSRQQLLAQLDQHGPESIGLGPLHSRAFDMLTNDQVHAAFDLNRESDQTREKYGRHIHGQSLLLARRLVQAGVSLVCVNWHQDHQNFWDTHGNNFNRLKHDLMPPADRGFSALLDDLSERGMLDSTLLVWVGEFGRRPQVNAAAGRDHWPFCSSAVFAGGCIRGGNLFGRSNKIGSHPAEDTVRPADITATMFHAMGVDPATILHDRESRPHALTIGKPVWQLF